MTASPHCTGTDLDRRGELRLPVLEGHQPQGVIRRSRSGRRRAIVLAVVQALIIVHVVLWVLSGRYGWWGGRTTTPIEPSESMEFFKNGVVNAGLIFFALALLSTLILGRWFCGWGCHLVMLQDLCGWLMRKAGIRPKAFRSRLLVYVPLLLALYMFIWPAFYRLAIAPWTRPDLEWPGFSVHLVTTEFWRTFAGVAVAIPFLIVCGFGAVYFLGAKGFCTYGCPYGGFFAPLDEFAVGRIRVTDACEHCGHCTAVCTSNVRVHEEVREYGMVVDPGCMKCLDCVSVCPNDALYFGLGRPAHLKGEPAHRRPKRRYDLTWPQEFAMTAVFALAFFSVRGVYGLVPMLMAAGVAGVVTFLAWKAWRVFRDRDVRFHRWQLSMGGRVTRAGWVFAGIAVLAVTLTAHCGVVNGVEYAGRLDERAVRRLHETDPHAARDRAGRALGRYRVALSVGEGGIGLAPNARVDLAMARMHWYRGELAEAEARLARAIDRSRTDEELTRQYLTVLRAQGRLTEAIEHGMDVLKTHPGFDHLRTDVAAALVEQGRADDARELLEGMK